MSEADPAEKPITPTPEPGGPKAEPGRLSDASLQEVHAERMEEKEEPAVGFSPVPVAMIMLFTALTFWSALYIGNHAGGFHWNVYDPNWRPGETSTVEAPDPMKIGARIFKNACQQCHGPEGKGVAGTYPPLAGSPWLEGPAERPVNVLLCGMNGPVTVEGGGYAGSMPPLGQSLKDSDIAAVLTFVRASWGNKASAVEDSVVAQERSSLGVRAPFTPEEVLQKYPLGMPDPAAAKPAAAPAGNSTAAPGNAMAAPAAK